AITVEEGGRVGDITEEAVDASIALLAPRVEPD
ncbi:MAG TPA: TetR/AcrR family transcriptional regulator, partial [Mycobacterium sp.]|nr:TetR/AcrR family transcriptional regulator [Mycobacterium sp.]HZN80796.1 TetR/AcrR family transcriptional regulator [Mycobacterium sp.]